MSVVHTDEIVYRNTKNTMQWKETKVAKMFFLFLERLKIPSHTHSAFSENRKSHNFSFNENTYLYALTYG